MFVETAYTGLSKDLRWSIADVDVAVIIFGVYRVS
jgi:hypothetical protein